MQVEGVHLRVARHPLKVERFDAMVPEGPTVAELLEIAQPDPVLLRHAHVYVGDSYIPPEMWSRVRPKSGAVVTARAFLPLHGGGGGKSPLRTILIIAVIAAAAFVSGGSAGLLGATFAEGTTAASLLGAGVGAAGLLAVNALVPASSGRIAALSSGTGGAKTSPTLFIEGARNQARPFEPVPSILGRHKVVPAYGARPYTEIVGNDQYLRLLFVWGIGPLSVPDFKIADTPIADFDDVEIEHRSGLAGDAPLTLFPGIVDQENFAISLTSAADWQQRTASDDADELSIDILFPSGLFQITDTGSRVNRVVVIQIEYRKVGDPTWLPIPRTGLATTFAEGWQEDTSTDTDDVYFRQVRFTHKLDAAIRHGIRWKTGARAQYEIRMRRTTADTTSTQIIDTLSWTALRRFTNEDPINSPVPMAKTALVIKATDQLNGVVDEFNGVAQTIALDYVGTDGWVEGPTSNPASLFRHVLQGKANANPLADARIDLEDLEAFHDWCVLKGYEFNMVRDFSASIWDTLVDICAAAQASPTQRDGKWGVIIDQPQTIPVSHITPRNSREFVIEKAFVEPPHGWRVQFMNEDENWANDERIVYSAGYDEITATKFEPLDLPGITDPDQIWAIGRFFAGAAEHRPERWTFMQDMEHLVCRRGDMVRITHDILLVGEGSGRIKSVVTDTDGDIVQLQLDETVTMLAASSYGLSVRTVADAAVTFQIVSQTGDFTTVTPSTPLSAGTVAAGDLFGFGLLGSETDDGLVLSIEPTADFNARVTLIPYRAEVYATGTIPPFTTNITPLAVIPAPTITDVRSDESVLVFGPGESLEVRAAVSFLKLDDLDAEVEVQYRPTETGEPFVNAEIVRQIDGEVMLTGFRSGETWDIRMRFVVPARLPGPYAYAYNQTMVGKSTPPGPLANLTVSAFGGQAFMRWSRPTELDVQFGGEVRFRHSELFTGASWSQSVSIGEAARARDLMATLPLKGGTYLVRVFDVEYNPSDIVSVTTKQASVQAFANVDTVDEASAFTGPKSNVEVDGINLQLLSNSDGEVLSTGTYDFAAGFDFGAVTRVRLTTRITASSFDVSDLWDDRMDPIDDWEDIDGVDQAQADIQVFARFTDDDPASTDATWTAYQRLDSMEVEVRGAEFMAVLSSSDPAFNIAVTTLGVDAEELNAGT